MSEQFAPDTSQPRSTLQGSAQYRLPENSWKQVPPCGQSESLVQVPQSPVEPVVPPVEVDVATPVVPMVPPVEVEVVPVVPWVVPVVLVEVGPEVVPVVEVW